MDSFMVLYVLLGLFVAVKHSSGLCSNEQRLYELFGTKTLYVKVAGKLPPKRLRAPAECTPIFMYGMLRHGARHPSGAILPDLENLLALAKKINSTGRATLCRKDLQNLKSWRVWSNKYANKNLTAYGAKEVREVARRYRNMLPELLRGNTRTRLRLSSTNFSRTVDSMFEFGEALGISPGDAEVFNVVSNEENSMLNDNCPKYVRDVEENPHSEEEFESFLAGDFIRRVKRKVARRLGVDRSVITGDILWSIYADGCYYQQLVEARNTPWCKVFTRRDLKILEYASDLEDYTQRSFHSDIAFKWTCAIAKDIVGAVQNASHAHQRGIPHRLGRFQFGHTSMVAVTAANMGLYMKESPPTSENFVTQTRRAFRMSLFSPSAANIMFVLYSCTQDNVSTYKVQTFWNERLLQDYPKCNPTQPKGMCDLDAWLDAYQEFVPGSQTECNHDKICAL